MFNTHNRVGPHHGYGARARAHRSHLPFLLQLDDRINPASLVHSLYPDPTGPQDGGSFGRSVATGSSFRVIGEAYSDLGSMYHVGQAFVYNASTNALVTILNNPTPATLDYFGGSVAVSGNYVVVGAYQDDNGATNAGSAYVYNMTSPTPTVPVLTLANPTPMNNDYFGYSVAMSGKYVVVGAENDNAGATFSGSAYVYDLTSTSPTVPVVTLNNPTPAINDTFGNAVAVSGQFVLVGAIYDDTLAGDSGSAYLYDLTSPTPSVPIVSVSNPSSAGDDYFGTSVAISGKYFVVGADHDDTGALNAGAAYVYDLTSTTPAQPVANLINPAPGGGDVFGYSVAVSTDVVVIGAQQDSTSANGAGSAYVYRLNNLAQSPIVINNPAPAADDFFGNAVAASGNSVVIGALLDDAGTFNAGSAYVYAISPSGASLITSLSNPTPAAGDLFGASVATSADYLVVGAYKDDAGAANAGAVYIYNVNSLTPTTPIAVIVNPSPAESDYFGNAVAVFGKYVVIGAYLDDTGKTDSGTAYVYDLTASPPGALVATLNNPTPAVNDNFGESVAVSGSIVVVGAKKDDTGKTDAGSAYVYDLASATPTIPIFSLNNPAPLQSGYFGVSVATNGNVVVIGASQNGIGLNAIGSAYVYDLASATPATPIWTLANPTPAILDLFGGAVAIDGKYVVVGADQDDTGFNDAGSAYVYDLTAATPNVPIVTLNNPTPANADNFGVSVAVSGKYVIVGAYHDDTGAIDAGSANVYDLTSATPSISIATITNPVFGNSDSFGNSVAALGTNVVIGSIMADAQNFDQGAAYVYTLAPPRVDRIKINNGDAQRSRVTSLTVTFDQMVGFTGSPAAAFQLNRQSDGQAVTMNASVVGNSVTLTFTNGAVDFGSLAHGRYTLTIDANQVTNSNGKLDGNADGTPGDNYVLVGTPANGLFRLFGDSDGDGTVAANDFILLRLSFGGSSTIFDLEGDGSVSANELIQFRLRFGGSI